MRKSKEMAPWKNIKVNTTKQPDIRDNLDSRKNEEQNFKGDDLTHNSRDSRNKPHRK